MNIWRLMSFLWLMILPSCMKTEILNAPRISEQVDTIQRVRTETDTTTIEERVQMGFNPTVEDWNETETEINT